jgi:hypothetical protein
VKLCCDWRHHREPVGYMRNRMQHPKVKSQSRMIKSVFYYKHRWNNNTINTDTASWCVFDQHCTSCRTSSPCYLNYTKLLCWGRMGNRRESTSLLATQPWTIASLHHTSCSTALSYAQYGALTAALMSVAILWDITTCIPYVNRCFGGTYRLHLQDRKSSAQETSVQQLPSHQELSWLQIQRFGFESRHYQTFWEVVGLELGPLSLVSTIKELLGRKSNGSGLESREYGRRVSAALITRHSSICKTWH